MHVAVPIIIIAIICIQIFFFVKNFWRMQEFGNIFTSHPDFWKLRRNSETNLVDGIFGDGNNIFNAIVNSINKYLGNNSGSVIDFGLLKDAVDRHCDSVENDIATQTPIPLYWGLAGTMAGVILGLWDLLSSNAILTLMGSGAGQIDSSAGTAAMGINSLLSGVAWAMGASICGILLTTINSILFKRCKLKEEDGKNSFLAWMQSELLPELPSDTSQALNNLVKNLNKFNNTFADNTTNLGNALEAVNQSYAIQAEIIKAVHDMDVMKMAKANIRVLQELEQCTDKLETFNQYLNDIEGYTEAIHRFETLFGEQADRLHILEEIRDFFERHKAEIAKTTADADIVLRDSLENIKESTSSNVTTLHNQFIAQSEQFKSILQQERDSFEQLNRQIKAQFSAQLDKMPQLAKQLEEITAIPVRLDKLIEKIEKSNARLAADIAGSLKQTLQTARVNAQLSGNGGGQIIEGSTTPGWMKLTGWCAIIIIAIACIFNMVTYFIPKEQPEVTEETTTETNNTDSMPAMITVDSAQNNDTAKQSISVQEEQLPANTANKSNGNTSSAATKTPQP
ncbi:MAG: hypothetical protein ACI303_06655 [Lepagella sp.]